MNADNNFSIFFNPLPENILNFENNYVSLKIAV